MSLAHLPLERELGETTLQCPKKCGSYLIEKLDAIGRTRLRCPKCDGVSKPRPRHPDECLVPQTLARVAIAAGPALPLLAPGQIRCQWCASGIDPKDRYCSDICHQLALQERRKRPCRGCERVFVPTAERPTHCAACVAKRGERAAPVRLCLGCHRITSRPRGGKRETKDCAECRPLPAAPTRLCLTCHRTTPRIGGRPTSTDCALCKADRRSARVTRAELRRQQRQHRVHPKDLPDDDARRVAWIAKMQASARARGRASASFNPRPCKHPRCSTVFNPTGPNGRYCEAHR